MFLVDLIVKPRSGVRDPQGEAVGEALHGLGYPPDSFAVHCVGRYLHMEIDAPTEEEARRVADDMCKRLLVNPNLETYDITLQRK
jgi:phosphoribosylformylglycinamidine synthase